MSTASAVDFETDKMKFDFELFLQSFWDLGLIFCER